MVILDTTVVNVAFQTLRAEFGASLNDSQWIISIYVLTLGISTPLSAFLADRYGMKRIYLVGLGIFILGSFLSGISPTLAFMIAARALQGFGGGIALPLGTAILLRSFPAKEQGAALGIFGIASLVAPALGPILGGYLVDLHLWRFIFFINPPIGDHRHPAGLVLFARIQGRALAGAGLDGADRRGDRVRCGALRGFGGSQFRLVGPGRAGLVRGRRGRAGRLCPDRTILVQGTAAGPAPVSESRLS